MPLTDGLAADPARSKRFRTATVWVADWLRFPLAHYDRCINILRAANMWPLVRPRLKAQAKFAKPAFLSCL
jgi:hypothetical protein